jgi:hypothetical protein
LKSLVQAIRVACYQTISARRGHAGV